MKNKDYCIYLAILALINFRIKGDSITHGALDQDIKDAVDYLKGLSKNDE